MMDLSGTDISHWATMTAHHIMADSSTVADAKLRPSTLYQPEISRDGGRWCALLGKNIAEGVCGFGTSPEKAFADFDEAWRRDLAAARGGK